MPVVIHDPLTVLLIEDNRDDEQLALRALRTCGLPLFVRVARDGQRGLAAMGLDGPPREVVRRMPDMVISDLKMPRMHGDEVLRRVREFDRLNELPFVIFTSSDEQEDVERCNRLGVTAYCKKPVDYQEFIECVRNIARCWLTNDTKAREPFCLVDAPEGTQTFPSKVL